MTIPVGTWHRLFVGSEPWEMLSFHAVAARELIEEKPVVANRLDGDTTQKRYEGR